MSDADARQKINQLFASVAGGSDMDGFIKLIDVMRAQLQQEMDSAHKAYVDAPSNSARETAAVNRRELYRKAVTDLTSGPLLLQLHMQYRQTKALEDIASALKEMQKDMRLLTEGRELDKPIPPLKSHARGGQKP